MLGVIKEGTEEEMAATICQAFRNQEGDILAFLRVVFLIILRDYFGTVARLVVGVVFVMRVYHAHVECHFPAPERILIIGS